MSGRGSQVPEAIGPYEVVRRLGVGGMAEVFEARAHRAAGVVQPVCIKRILPAYARDRRFVRLFVREARVSFALQHGKIAQVFDFGHEEGEVYLVMELVDGRAVSDLLRRLEAAGQALPLAHALKIITDVLEALEHAHTRTAESGEALGIVHRDVSPQNVLVAFEGQVKLVDFGIARALASAQSRQGQGEGLQGKLPYLPPEQVRDGEADLRSDVYAAGALLFELLAGRPPFVGSAEAARAGLLLGNIPQLSEIAPEIDPHLAELVSWAMAARPEDRPDSAAALQHELLSWAHAHGELASERELGELLRFGFASELTDSGRAVELPPSFERTLSRTLPAVATGRPWTLGRILEVGLITLLPLAAILALFWWTLSPTSEPWNLEVRSRPSGARILLDGRATGLRTDALLQDLDREGVRRVRLELPDHRPVERQVDPGTSVLALTLESTLRVQVKEPPTTPEEPEPVKQEVLRIERKEEGRMELELDLGEAAADTTSWPLRWERVDPRRRISLAVSGDVLVIIGREQDVGFWLARDGSGGHLGSGLVRPGRREQIPPGTARLGLGVLDGDTCHNNADALQMRLRWAKQTRAVRVDGRTHCISLGGKNLPNIEGLNGQKIYRVDYTGPKGGPAIILMSYGSTSLLALSRDPSDALKRIQPGESVELPYIQSLIFLRLEQNLAGSPVAHLTLTPRAGLGQVGSTP